MTKEKEQVVEFPRELEERGIHEDEWEKYYKRMYTDALTGTYNRWFFEDCMKKREYHGGVAMVDIDFFKAYNDIYGHHTGDEVLKKVTRVVISHLSPVDRLIRYGGDEFLIFIYNVGEAAFSERLAEIREDIQSSVLSDSAQLQLSASIGGVILQNEDMEAAVDRADKLMYLAKRERNKVVTEKEYVEAYSEEHGEKVKPQILIVDDSQINREILKEILVENYRVIEAANGEECLSLIREKGSDIALILLDIIMPYMDGFSVLNEMQNNRWIEDIPVIIISTETTVSSIRQAYKMGASDYISRPFDASMVYQRVENMIKLHAKERKMISLICNEIYKKERNSQLLVGVLSQIIAMQNGENGMHVLFMNMVVELLLKELTRRTDFYQLTWEDQNVIAQACSFHDIGKMTIPDEILNKPGKLTEEEFEIVKTHAKAGADMIDQIVFYEDEKLVKTAQEICRWHHERYDGKGYPDGLKGEQIPISAQIVSLADVYVALTGHTVYREAYSHEEAMRMILTGECGCFNPLLIECLKGIERDIRREAVSMHRESEKK